MFCCCFIAKLFYKYMIVSGMDYSLHSKEMANVCRLCCMKISIDRRYSTLKSVVFYKAEIQKFFNHNIEEDDKNIYPKLICDNCRRKLDKVKNGDQFLVQVIATFSPHSNSCLLCKNHKLSKYSFKVQCVHQQSSSKVSEESVVNSSSTDDSETPLIKMIENVAQDCEFFQVFTSEEKKIFTEVLLNSEGAAIVKLSVVVLLTDFTWKIHTFEKEIKEGTLYQSLPKVINEQNVTRFFMTLQQANLCIRNDFPKTIQHQTSRGLETQFYDKNGKIKGQIETLKFCDMGALNIISSTKRDTLVKPPQLRCESCQNLRQNLLKIEKRIGDKDNDSSAGKFTSNVFLTRDQVTTKLNEAQKVKWNLMRQNERLQKKIDKIFESESVEVDGDIKEIIERTFKQSDDDSFDQNSPKYLLWDEQKKFSKLESSCGMRWHPVIICWCLSIYLQSPGAYEMLRKSGFISLPHRSTLNQYAGFANIGTGFNPDVIKYMYNELNIDKLEDFRRNVIILFDEMKIKTGLVFNQASGKLIGFTDIGDINAELEEFDHAVSMDTSKDLATDVLGIMIRGVFMHLNFPVAYFASTEYDSYQLCPVIWEAVRVVEYCGLYVRAFVCDGASPNRRFFKLHMMSNKENVSVGGVVFWTWNSFSPQRKIFFLVTLHF